MSCIALVSDDFRREHAIVIWGVVSRPDFWTGVRVNILGREAVVRRERGHRSDETNGIASSLGLGGGRDARWILAPPDPEINCSWKPCSHPLSWLRSPRSATRLSCWRLSSRPDSSGRGPSSAAFSPPITLTISWPQTGRGSCRERGGRDV